MNSLYGFYYIVLLLDDWKQIWVMFYSTVSYSVFWKKLKEPPYSLGDSLRS